MRSRLMVISKIRRKHAAQVALVEYDEVIETLSTDRTNDALHISVLPRRARCSNNLFDAHHTNAIAEILTI